MKTFIRILIAVTAFRVQAQTVLWQSNDGTNWTQVTWLQSTNTAFYKLSVGQREAKFATVTLPPAPPADEWAVTNSGVALEFGHSYLHGTGSVGLHIDKSSLLGKQPNVVSYDIDGVSKWESGIDYEGDDFVVAFTWDKTMPWGTGDMLRICPTNRHMVFGPTVGYPGILPAQYTFLRPTGAPGIEVRGWCAQADTADALVIRRNSGADGCDQFIDWTIEGGQKSDWRVGMFHNPNSYDLAIFCGTGQVTSATAPGKQVATFSQTGLKVDGAVIAGTLLLKDGTIKQVMVGEPDSAKPGFKLLMISN